MPTNPFRNRLLWSTQGGGLLQPVPGAVPAASLNTSGDSGNLDVNGVDELLIHVILTSFTGGTAPSFAPEWDILDDKIVAGNWAPNVIPLWKPAAVTTATKWLTEVSAKGLGAAPTIAGWTVTLIPAGFGSLGKFAWTVGGTVAPTAVTWEAYVYGKGIA